jgi:hypothetical protein
LRTLRTGRTAERDDVYSLDVGAGRDIDNGNLREEEINDNGLAGRLDRHYLDVRLDEIDNDGRTGSGDLDYLDLRIEIDIDDRHPARRTLTGDRAGAATESVTSG